jgi:hypothetical protein
MTHIIEEPKAPVQQPNVGPYHTPRLLVYGAMRELTASGSRGEREGRRREANKRP